MDKYNEQIEEFKKDAKSEYFHMIMEEDRLRRRFYYAAVILMVFMPLLVISIRYVRTFNVLSKNEDRVEEERKEIDSFAISLENDKKYLSTLNYENGLAKLYLDKLYNDKKLSNVYFDVNYTHQCLGYLLVLKENDSYHIYTSDYCQM